MNPSSTIRTNTDWLGALRATGSTRDTALIDLRAIILSGLPYALAGWLNPSDPHFDALAEDVVQETLLRVLDRLDTFEGRSQFTTWVQKIAVRIALTELRRRRWRDVSLESMARGEDEPTAVQPDTTRTPDPALAVERADLIARIGRILREELTDKQRQAMMAVMNGTPMEEVARHMNTNRNALYKLMHDARLHLKNRLRDEGLTPADVLAAFERK